MINFKKKTKKIVLLLVSVFLFTACNDDDKEEKGAPCDYTFVSATVANTTVEVNTPQVIKLNITKTNSETCDTAYKMSYKVMLDDVETTDGVFTYNNVAQAHGEKFNIPATNFEGSFASSQVGGTYKIIFTIVNDKAATATQTKEVSLDYTYPPIVITPLVEENVLYAKQTGVFKYALAGGGTLGNYKLTIIPVGGIDLGAELTIGNAEVVFENSVEVNNEFKLFIRPTEVGETTYKIQIEKNGIMETRSVSFNSKMPKFDFEVMATPIVINGSLTQYAYLKYTNMTFLDNYTEHIKYTLTPSSTGGTTIAYTPTSMINVTGVPMPFVLNGFKYGTLMQAGTVLKLTITNEFGYSITKQL